MENLQLDPLQRFEIPDLVRFDLGRGGLPRANLTAGRSRAEVYLHGAQVTGFQKLNEPPLLFLSELSRFAVGTAIRGGIPICFPWFGPRPGAPAHGFARITDWELIGAAAALEEGTSLRLRLPESLAANSSPPFAAELVVTLTDGLKLELSVTNKSADQPFSFEECLHSYFRIGDVHQVFITGLESREYRDHTSHEALGNEPATHLRIGSQTDRTYLDQTGPVEIHDPVLRRKIRIEKSGSRSTVVWNPWTTQLLADLGPEEYRHMVCVESGNVDRNRISLAPGGSASMVLTITSQPWNDSIA